MSNEHNKGELFEDQKTIDSKYLYNLLQSGFKPVPLSEDHTPLQKWTSIYENCHYWKKENFEDTKVLSKFKNVASTVGKTHIKDVNNRDLYLQVLDVDSENVYNLVNIPMSEILTNYPKLKSKIDDFLNSLGLSKDEAWNSSLLDILKQITFVTKTKKPYGYHIWWLSHLQNKTILSSHCKKDFEFEIKTSA